MIRQDAAPDWIHVDSVIRPDLDEKKVGVGLEIIPEIHLEEDRQDIERGQEDVREIPYDVNAKSMQNRLPCENDLMRHSLLGLLAKNRSKDEQ